MLEFFFLCFSLLLSNDTSYSGRKQECSLIGVQDFQISIVLRESDTYLLHGVYKNTLRKQDDFSETFRGIYTIAHDTVILHSADQGMGSDVKMVMDDSSLRVLALPRITRAHSLAIDKLEAAKLKK